MTNIAMDDFTELSGYVDQVHQLGEEINSALTQVKLELMKAFEIDKAYKHYVDNSTLSVEELNSILPQQLEVTDEGLGFDIGHALGRLGSWTWDKIKQLIIDILRKIWNWIKWHWASSTKQAKILAEYQRGIIKDINKVDSTLFRLGRVVGVPVADYYERINSISQTIPMIDELMRKVNVAYQLTASDVEPLLPHIKALGLEVRWSGNVITQLEFEPRKTGYKGWKSTSLDYLGWEISNLKRAVDNTQLELTKLKPLEQLRKEVAKTIKNLQRSKEADQTDRTNNYLAAMNVINTIVYRTIKESHALGLQAIAMCRIAEEAKAGNRESLVFKEAPLPENETSF